MLTSLFQLLLPAAFLLFGSRPDTTSAPLTLTRLELDLALDTTQGTVAGTARLTLVNRTGAATGRVSLLLNRLMRVTRASTSRGLATRVTQEVVVFQDDASYQVNAVTLDLDRPVAAGDSVTLTLEYGGILVGYVETGSLYIRDRVTAEFTILREDALAWPVPGVPSWDINRRAERGDFTFQAGITAPASMVIAMGGTRDTVVEANGLRTWRYHSDAPVPFLNITAAPYRILEDSQLRIFYFPADSGGARRVAQAVRDALARFRGWFGPMSRPALLTVMEIPEGFGSQASLVAGIIQTADAFRDRTQLRQLYHELSHLWNVPDREQPSARWNEGLATWLQFRMAEELDGWSDWPARDARVVTSLLERCPGSGCDSIPFVRFGERRLTDYSYPLGMLLFRMLSQVMGDDRFDRAYAGYFQSHQEGGTAAELMAAFETADRRTRRIFDDWVRTTRWYERLKSGEQLERIVDQYRMQNR